MQKIPKLKIRITYRISFIHRTLPSFKSLATSRSDTAQGFDFEKSSLREDVSNMFVLTIRKPWINERAVRASLPLELVVRWRDG
jgi:hypothetical protein